MSNPHLPQEILDYIVDILHDEFHAQEGISSRAGFHIFWRRVSGIAPPVSGRDNPFPVLSSLSACMPQLFHVRKSSDSLIPLPFLRIYPCFVVRWYGAATIPITAHRVLDLPGGLHFRKLALSWSNDVDPPGLVVACRHTVGSLEATHFVFGTFVGIWMGYVINPCLWMNPPHPVLSTSQKCRTSNVLHSDPIRCPSDASHRRIDIFKKS
jgi:hypothetical protein